MVTVRGLNREPTQERMRRRTTDRGRGLTSHSEHAALAAAVAERRDREAFTRLFDYYTPRLEAYLVRLGSDSASAEEIAQDALATLWRKAHLFDADKSSLATWLYRIARNRRIDMLRRDRASIIEPEDPVFDAADGTDIEGQVDIQQREEAVRAALNHLPQEQLVLVRLAFFDGLTHIQISERTGLPLGTVKSRIRLAFTRLRRSLEAGGVAEVG